jgi:two-component system, OmpR family, sensor histidine kinase KdpD
MTIRKNNLDSKPEKQPFKSGFRWRGYTASVGLVLLATLLGFLVRNFFAPTNIIMIYLLCVTVSAIVGGLGPSIMVSILSVLAFDFFFVPPHLTFAVDNTQYIFTFIVLLFVGVFISYLTSRVRRETESARLSEQETAALYSLSRDLAVSGDLESYIKAISERIKEVLGFDVIIFLPDSKNRGRLLAYDGKSTGPVKNLDGSIASGLFQQLKTPGCNNEIISDNHVQYMPLVTGRGPVGIITLKNPRDTGDLTPEQKRLFSAYADLAAVAIEGIMLADELHNAQVDKATEKLQTALLNAISHDLRTPLVSVIGTLSSLQEEEISLDETTKKSLIQVAREEADRLNHMISNLLDESRIEAGAIRLFRQPAEAEDLVGAALEQLGNRAEARSIKIDIPEKIPFVSVDFGLIVQTLVNITDNALKYSPQDSPIEINARQIFRELCIEIIDRGIGISEQDLPHIFDKFYRIKRPNNVTGTGLGLSISKGIIEAHGGHIDVSSNPGAGTTVRVFLPVHEFNKTGESDE